MFVNAFCSVPEAASPYSGERSRLIAMGRKITKSVLNATLSGLICSICSPPCGPSLSLFSNRKESPWASSPLHQVLRLGRSSDGILVFGNTVESPGLPGVPVRQRSAVPIWNWHQAKIGCVFPWAISEESAWRRSLGHLRKPKLWGTGTCLQRAFQMAAPKGVCSAYWSSLIFWDWGSRFSLPWTRRRWRTPHWPPMNVSVDLCHWYLPGDFYLIHIT